VIEGKMTLGDLVLVNSFMIQLYIPLNFLGVIYREIKQSLADMERLFGLLEQNREVADAPDAKPLVTHGARSSSRMSTSATKPSARSCSTSTSPSRPAPPPRWSATAARASRPCRACCSAFMTCSAGGITIDGQDMRNMTQDSLRHAIGIVPQDTVLFNDTIEYNIAYGRPGASREHIVAAARAASIHDFIESLPDGYATMVGERGLKLSGGEKQRVAIARTLLKNPAILIFDEATSALDSKAEQAIQAQLKEIAKQRTTLVIAHRLSTIADAHQILVLDHGRIVERGTQHLDSHLHRIHHVHYLHHLHHNKEPTMKSRFVLGAVTAMLACVQSAYAADPTEQQFRALYKELVETNTTRQGAGSHLGRLADPLQAGGLSAAPHAEDGADLRRGDWRRLQRRRVADQESP
jgi:ABC-type multidrug transport system ATPase subunit